MRKVSRPDVELPTLSAGGAGGARYNAQLNDLALRSTFPSHWNNADIRGSLIAAHGKACAYCLRLLAENYRGDVEHFRPKSQYWWLAYKLDNYVMSCAPCNRTYKRDRFPLAVGVSAVSFSDRANLSTEQRILFDPAIDPIENWFTIDLERPLNPVIPQPGRSAALRTRLQECIDFFRLNTNLALVKARLEKITRTKNQINQLSINDTPAAREAVQRNASRYQPQSIVVRALVKEFDPKLLPKRATELAWHIEDLAMDLETAKLLQELEGADLARDIDELSWALAVLWKRPPTGTQATIQNMLQELNVLAEVAPKRAQLD